MEYEEASLPSTTEIVDKLVHIPGWLIILICPHRCAAIFSSTLNAAALISGKGCRVISKMFWRADGPSWLNQANDTLVISLVMWST